MLFYQSLYGHERFWAHVRNDTLETCVGSAETIQRLYVKARKAYLTHCSATPNETARLVDEWIAFLQSPDKIQPLRGSGLDTAVRWSTLRNAWRTMKNNGDLVNSGRDIVQQPESDNPGAPSSVIDLCSSSASSSDTPSEVALSSGSSSTRSDGGSEVSRYVLNPAILAAFAKGTKRRIPDAPSALPAKRQALESLRTNKPSNQPSHTGRPTTDNGPATPDSSSNETEDEDEDAGEEEGEEEDQEEEPQALALSSKNFGAYQRSTNYRLSQCEEKQDKIDGLILGQDLRSGSDRDLITQQSGEIIGIKARLREVERLCPRHASHLNNRAVEEDATNPSTDEDIRAIHEKIHALEEAVDDHKKRFSARDTYIRTEVKHVWNNVADLRIKALETDLAAHKSQLSDLRKESTERVESLQNEDSRITDLERVMRKKYRFSKQRNLKLQARNEEIEKQLEKIVTQLQSSSSPRPSEASRGKNKQDAQEVVNKTTKELSGLARRMDGTQGTIGTMTRRLVALEAGQAELKRVAFSNRAGLEKRISEQGEVIARLESMFEALRRDTESQKSQRGRVSSRSQPGQGPRAVGLHTHRQHHSSPVLPRGRY
ncbi:hypothetical protein B0T19DRAFT_281481 [Cercophora scortea]|uniref:Uncharacterized protein n=1 Tax=Cercophora scortea TaxID=314031 RepID=A0AAE0I7V9_9PEZI|nr:hypothetical protein B0T19DRAFT_281481 [Cercophora scortea]